MSRCWTPGLGRPWAERPCPPSREKVPFATYPRKTLDRATQNKTGNNYFRSALHARLEGTRSAVPASPSNQLRSERFRHQPTNSPFILTRGYSSFAGSQDKWAKPATPAPNIGVGREATSRLTGRMPRKVPATQRNETVPSWGDKWRVGQL